MMGGFGFGGFGMILWVVFLGLIVWAVVAVGRRTSDSTSPERARAILDERFARGEVSVEEYQKLRAALRA